MSNKDLDSLFKSKLSNLKQEPSADAWKKIQGQLPAQRKYYGYWFMRVAAALLLLMLVGTYFWVFNDATLGTSQQLASQETTSEIENPRIEKESPVASIENDDDQDNPQQNSGEPVEKEKTNHTPKEHEPIKIQGSQKEQLIASVSTNEKEQKVEREILTQPDTTEKNASEKEQESTSSTEKLIADATLSTESASTQQKATGTTLEFDLSDFSKIEKTQVVVQDTGAVKTESGFKKMLAVVNDVKESGFGDLRQKKNEILALNFMRKKNEERNQ